MEMMTKLEDRRGDRSYLAALLVNLGLRPNGFLGGLACGLMDSYTGTTALVLICGTVGVAAVLLNPEEGAKGRKASPTAVASAAAARPERAAPAAEAPAAGLIRSDSRKPVDSLPLLLREPGLSVEAVADVKAGELRDAPSASALKEEARKLPAVEGSAAGRAVEPPAHGSQDTRQQARLNGQTKTAGPAAKESRAPAPAKRLADQGGLTLASMSGMSSGVGMSFQDIYRKPMAAASAASATQSEKGRAPRVLAAARRISVSDADKSAYHQLRDTEHVTTNHSRQAQISSQGYGGTYDGARGTGASSIGNTATGAAAGGAGIESGGVQAGEAASSTSLSQKEVPTPTTSTTSDSDNQTPYQWLVNMGLAVLALSFVALVAAKLLNKKAKTDATGQTKMMVKMLAGVALAGAAAAAYVGYKLMCEPYSQATQGSIFITVSVLLGWQAASTLMGDSSSSSPASDAVSAASSLSSLATAKSSSSGTSTK